MFEFKYTCFRMNFLIIGQLNNGEVEKLEKYLNTKKKKFLSVGFDSYLQNKNNRIRNNYNKKRSNMKIR